MQVRDNGVLSPKERSGTKVRIDSAQKSSIGLDGGTGGERLRGK